MNPSAIFEDFERKYQGSFVQVELENKEPELYQLRKIIKNNTRFPQLELQSNKTGTILLNYNTKARIIFKVPQPRFIQVENQALYYTRVPARQWKRGLNNSNSVVISPLEINNIKRNKLFELNFKSINAIFNTKNSTLEEALYKLNKEKYNGVVLSKNMAIFNSELHKEFLLCYKFCIVGTVNKTTGKITTDIFEEEIRNEIK
jgi:formyltetrahydrofolate hydrolase